MWLDSARGRRVRPGWPRLACSVCPRLPSLVLMWSGPPGSLALYPRSDRPGWIGAGPRARNRPRGCACAPRPVKALTWRAFPERAGCRWRRLRELDVDGVGSTPVPEHRRVASCRFRRCTGEIVRSSHGRWAVPCSGPRRGFGRVGVCVFGLRCRPRWSRGGAPGRGCRPSPRGGRLLGWFRVVAGLGRCRGPG